MPTQAKKLLASNATFGVVGRAAKQVLENFLGGGTLYNSINLPDIGYIKAQGSPLSAKGCTIEVTPAGRSASSYVLGGTNGTTISSTAELRLLRLAINGLAEYQDSKK